MISSLFQFPALVFFCFGAIIGSFLNVVIFRYNTGKNLGGRSKCFSCGKTLGAIELIPILSYVMQKGRCRTCHSKISPQYAIVEAVTGASFALTVAVLSFAYSRGAMSLAGFSVSLAYFCFSWAVLIAISAYDARHKIIPDGLVWLFGLVSLAFVFGRSGTFSAPSVSDLLAGPAAALPFFLIWLVSRGRWMGLGDAKLALGIGWGAGMFGALASIIFSFWIGSAVSIAIIAVARILDILRNRLSDLSRGFTMKSEIPFAPFMVAGFFLAFVARYWFPSMLALLGL